MSDIKYERIFCAEQINVPPELPTLLKEYAKQLIRDDPTCGMKDRLEAEQKLYEWSYAFFKKMDAAAPKLPAVSEALLEN